MVASIAPSIALGRGFGGFGSRSEGGSQLRRQGGRVAESRISYFSHFTVSQLVKYSVQKALMALLQLTSCQPLAPKCPPVSVALANFSGTVYKQHPEKNGRFDVRDGFA
jgi:hypothetical protein